MKNLIIAIAAIALMGAMESSGQSLLGTTTSILGPDVTPPGGYAGTPQEYLTVYTTVTSEMGGYEYTYQFFNPAGDQLMNGDGTLQPGTSEIVDTFQVSFNGSASGAVVNGPYGGAYAANTGENGLTWFIYPVVAAGSPSPILSFFSDYAPVLGNAQALDSSLPSPWSSSNPGGEQVPVPNAPPPTPTPEPDTLTLLGLGVMGLGPVRYFARRLVGSK